MADFARLREDMVERQLRARGIVDPAVLAAFRAVPRERFVREGDEAMAYADRPLPIGCGQTISQPYVVALALAAAAIKPDDRVLEVGSGSGYVAALLGRIAGSVVAIERQPMLARESRARLEALGATNVQIAEGDGTLGWPGGGSFDEIIASASGDHMPQPLIDQLKPGGRLVMPIGTRAGTQELVRMLKATDGGVQIERLGSVRFVPLIGVEGFPPSVLH